MCECQAETDEAETNAANVVYEPKGNNRQTDLNSSPTLKKANEDQKDSQVTQSILALWS